MPSHPISCRSILVLSSHVRLGLPSGLFPSGIPTKILYALRLSHIRANSPAQPMFIFQSDRPSFTQQAQSHFCISWSLYFWIANWKTKNSAPNNNKHSLTSICSQFRHKCIIIIIIIIITITINRGQLGKQALPAWTNLVQSGTNTAARQGSAMYRLRIPRLLSWHLSPGCSLLPTKLQPTAHRKWSLETPENLLPITDRCGICYYTVRNTVELQWSERWLSESVWPFG